MEAFNAGTLAGAGSFRCDSCGFGIALHERDAGPVLPRVRRRELPSCRRCSATTYAAAAAPRGRGCARLARARRATHSSATATTWPSRTTSASACSRSRTAGPGSAAACRPTCASTTRRSPAGTRCSTATTAGRAILDDRSLNGVFRNGDRVELAELDDGDEIAIGPLQPLLREPRRPSARRRRRDDRLRPAESSASPSSREITGR